MARGGMEVGTWCREDVEELAACGQLEPTDHYWHEGMEDWALLESLLGTDFWPPPEPPAQPPPAQSPILSLARSWTASLTQAPVLSPARERMLSITRSPLSLLVTAICICFVTVGISVFLGEVSAARNRQAMAAENESQDEESGEEQGTPPPSAESPAQ